MLDYILQVLLFQTLFLAVYDLFLKKETFFQWNRVYLILTSLLAYLIPLIKFETVQEIIPNEYVVQLPEVMLSPSTTIEQTLDWSSILFISLQYIFWTGIIIASVLFLVKLYSILQLISNNEKEDKGNYLLVFLENNTAFSFFNYIFLGKTTADQNKQQIIKHELVHVQQKHSLDLLLFELQRIVCWFNPFSYIYQHRVSELHEFIADSKSIKETDKTTYFNNLLAETFGTQNISFINPFFKHSLIKKRIVMLHKNKSKQFLKLKYLLLLPVLASMLVYTSCEKSEPDIQKDSSVKELINELSTKAEEGKVSEEEVQLIIEFLSKTSIDNIVVSEKEQKMRKKLMTYLLQEKKNKILNDAIEIKDYSNGEEVPFTLIKQAPIFPGCENDKDPKSCFKDKVQEHVQTNFDMSIATTLGLASNEKKVYVQFTIDKVGAITNIRARGPHQNLEREAIRVMQLLPSMQSGMYNGKNIGVKYTLPITLTM